jgi:DNA primase
VCFDGDMAGKKASRRVADMLLPVITLTKIVKFALLPDNIDPDDFVKKYGREGFERLITDRETCCSLSEFLFRETIKNLSIKLGGNQVITPEERGRLQVELNSIVKNIKDQTVARNFDSFFRGEIFKITRFDSKKRASVYKDVTGINYNRHIGSSTQTIEVLLESLLGIENDIFLLLFDDLELVDLLYKVYNIDIFSIDFYGKNSKSLLGVILDVCEKEKVNEKEYLRDCLEKNGFDYYIVKGKVRTNSSFSSIGLSKESKTKRLYALMLEKNIMQLELEMKELCMKNEDAEKVKGIKLELENLHTKRLQLEEEF